MPEVMTRNEHLTDADLGLFVTNLTISMSRFQTEFAAERAASYFVAALFLFESLNQ